MRPARRTAGELLRPLLHLHAAEIARRLGVSEATVSRRLRKFGLTAAPWQPCAEQLALQARFLASGWLLTPLSKRLRCPATELAAQLQAQRPIPAARLRALLELLGV